MRRASLEQLLAMRRKGRAIVRALDVESGEEILIDPATDLSPLGRAAARALKDDASQRIILDNRVWFLTVYNTLWELVIIGAVHIAQALAQLGADMGFSVRVIDPRGAYAASERFAGVRVIQSWPDEALAAEPLTARSALIALSHDTKVDDPALVTALRSPAGYIGTHPRPAPGAAWRAGIQRTRTGADSRPGGAWHRGAQPCRDRHRHPG